MKDNRVVPGRPIFTVVRHPASGVTIQRIDIADTDVTEVFVQDPSSPEPSAKLTVGKPSLLEARRHLERGEYKSAIAEAQTTSEVYVKRLMQKLLIRDPRFGDPNSEMKRRQIQSFNLSPTNRKLRKLYEDLTGDASLVRQSFWSNGALQNHLDLRQGKTHAGAYYSRADAEASIAVVTALIKHVDAVTTAQGVTWYVP